MARYRLSRLAEADLAVILATSEERWGLEGRRRYAAVLAAAMRMVSAEPKARTSRDRDDLLPGVRSFHLRGARTADASLQVSRPVHIVYYRAAGPDLIEIVRVLHERMDPNRHISSDQDI